MSENKPQVEPEVEEVVGDLANDALTTLFEKMTEQLGKMSKDGKVDPDEQRAANQALFFLKCWEEAAAVAGTPGERLGMDDHAVVAAGMFVVSQLLADTEWQNLNQRELLRVLFTMGVLTGIEYQERRHA